MLSHLTTYYIGHSGDTIHFILYLETSLQTAAFSFIFQIAIKNQIYYGSQWVAQILENIFYV